MCWFGDGAASEGATHEAMNLAGVHKLPVVFFCENNGFAISVPLELQMPIASLAERAAALRHARERRSTARDALAVFARRRPRRSRALGPAKGRRWSMRGCPGSPRTPRRTTTRTAMPQRRRPRRDPLPRLPEACARPGSMRGWAPLDARRRTRSLRRTIAAQSVLGRPSRRLALLASDPSRDGRTRGRRGRSPGLYADDTDERPWLSVTLLQAVSEALHEEMARDPSVVVLGQDVGVKGGVFKATKGLHDEFGPLRVLDTPIAEIVIAGAAIGAAMMGLRPVAEFQFADYIFPAYDQIVNQAATIRWRSVGGFGVPVVFRAPFGAGVRGGVYHSQSVEAYYCHVPGLKVVVPATPADAQGPAQERHPRRRPGGVLRAQESYRWRREEVGGRPRSRSASHGSTAPGATLSIVTYGVGVHHAREAAVALAAEGIDVEILDLRTLVPMDREAIATDGRQDGHGARRCTRRTRRWASARRSRRSSPRSCSWISTRRSCGWRATTATCRTTALRKRRSSPA